MALLDWVRRRLRQDESASEQPHGVGDADRERFWALYRGITLRLLTAAPAIELSHPFGEPVRVGIAQDPLEADQLLPEPIPRQPSCAVCGSLAEVGQRLPASLQPEFANGFSYQVGVWVHPECLARCPDTGEQRGVPW